MLNIMRGIGLTTVIENFLTSQVYAFGPKVFRPAQLDCEALEQIDVTVTLDDYWQPYPTMIVEMPRDYARHRVVPCAQAGEMGIVTIMPPTHGLAFVISHFIHEIKLLALGMYFDSGQCITRFIWPKREGETIHAIMGGLNQFGDSLPTTQQEEETASAAFRVALNACLLMKTYDCKLIGPDNPSYHARLQRQLAKSRKNRNAKLIAVNERELRLIPMIYDFGQPVKLYREDAPASGVTGAVVSPHWRKGHWTMQPYGPQSSLRKRMLIAPILVNKHLLGQ